MKLFSKKGDAKSEAEGLGEVSVEENTASLVKDEVIEEKESSQEENIMTTIKKNNPKKRKKIIRIVVIVVTILAVGGAVGARAYMSSTTAQKVTTVEATSGEIEQIINTSGTVQSEEVKTYFSDVTAPILKLNAEAGNTVKTGEELIIFDTEDLELSKKEADLTASATKKGLQNQLLESKENEIDFATSSTELGGYDAQIAALEAKINTCYCMITSNEKWMSDDGARLQAEIAELRTKKATVSKNSVKDEIQSDIDDKQHEINSHGTSDLTEYIRQGNEQLAKLKADKAESESTQKTSEKLILNGTEKSQISDNTELAEVNAQKATTNLERAKNGVKADFTGIITEVEVIEGSTVNEGAKLFTIANSENVKVDINISKYDIESIKIGQKVDVTIAGNSYKGTVQKIDRMAVENSAKTPVVRAEVHIENPDDKIYLGVEAKMNIHVAKAENAVLLPIELVNTDKDGYYCYVVNNGLVEKRSLKVGIQSDFYTEILEGIKPGDQVIKEIFDGIEEGMEVEAVPEVMEEETVK